MEKFKKNLKINLVLLKKFLLFQLCLVAFQTLNKIFEKLNFLKKWKFVQIFFKGLFGKSGNMFSKKCHVKMI